MSTPQLFNLLRAASVAAPTAAKLKKATQDIESIFVKDLLAAMRRTAKHHSMGEGSGMGEEMYQDIFDQAIAEASAKTGNLGISKTIYSQMAPIAIRSAIQRAMRNGTVSVQEKNDREQEASGIKTQP